MVNGAALREDLSHYRQQVFRTDPHSEALDQLSASAWLRTLPDTCPRFSAETVTDLVQGFSLAPHIEKPMYMLSAGSKRKVWLIAAMAAGAPLTLLDQPFAALDAPSMRFLIELLREASDHPSRAWLVADYEAPSGVALATNISL
jgi:ABC-type multidrug transport system ATPase subunit